MRNYFKTAVIGGGASGLITAIELLSGDNALKGEDVVVLERNDRVGKKLIATGNGQGNLTNFNGWVAGNEINRFFDDSVFGCTAGEKQDGQTGQQ